MGREGAACALARGGHSDDPRVRGTAHTIASNISQYLRSELAANPFKKAQGKTVLDPHAFPPTISTAKMVGGQAWGSSTVFPWAVLKGFAASSLRTCWPSWLATVCPVHL